MALALAKQQIPNIINDAIKKTKAAKTSKKVIKYLGTGRGEDIIFAQERSIKAIESADPVVEITIDAEPVLSNINSGISDFSSVVELDAKTEEITIEMLPNDSVDTQRKTKSSKTQKKSKPNTGKKSVAIKSKSKRENRNNSTASKKKIDSLEEKQLIANEISKTSSFTEEKKEQQPKQEQKSRAFVGLPQWKPPSR